MRFDDDDDSCFFCIMNLKPEKGHKGIEVEDTAVERSNEASVPAKNSNQPQNIESQEIEAEEPVVENPHEATILAEENNQTQNIDFQNDEDCSAMTANKEYIIETFGATNFNADIENAYNYYQAKGLNRRARNYIKSHQVKRKFLTTFPPKSSLKENKKVRFGMTRVMPFEKTDIIPRRPLENLAPQKSLLKCWEDKFVTRNHDYEIIGKSELLTAIGRIYNLCDLPLSIFNKDEAVISVELLARGVANAFKAKEMCWKHMTDEVLEKKDLELEDRDSRIEILESKVWTLAEELKKLKEVPEEMPGESDSVFQEEETEEKFETKWMNEKMKKLEISLEEKLKKEDSLTAENLSLKLEVKNLKDSLVESKKAIEPLLCRVRMFGEDLQREISNSNNFLINLIALDKIRRESLEFETKLQNVEKTNKTLLHENESLRMWNDALYNKTNHLEISIGELQSSLTLAQLQYKRLETTCGKVVKERDECHAEIRNLHDIYLANKSRSDSRIKQLKENCAKLMKDCKIRDEQIQTSEYELEFMKKLLSKFQGRMTKKKRETIIYFNASPSMEGGNLADKCKPSLFEFNHERRLNPLVNKVY